MAMTVAGMEKDGPDVQVEVLKAMCIGGKRIEPGTVVTVSRFLASELICQQRAKLVE